MPDERRPAPSLAGLALGPAALRRPEAGLLAGAGGGRSVRRGPGGGLVTLRRRPKTSLTPADLGLVTRPARGWAAFGRPHPS
ncbi:MAG: hypothetical protein IPK12_09420 [Gemmatimonadetes bacterium]|nr:hypothetical protein [Gemmatimonadota bacterium]